MPRLRSPTNKPRGILRTESVPYRSVASHRMLHGSGRVKKREPWVVCPSHRVWVFRVIAFFSFTFVPISAVSNAVFRVPICRLSLPDPWYGHFDGAASPSVRHTGACCSSRKRFSLSVPLNSHLLAVEVILPELGMESEMRRVPRNMY
jgi:hypothetical protein